MCCALKEKCVTLYISFFIYTSISLPIYNLCVLLLLAVWFVGILSVAVHAAAIGRCSRPRSGRSGPAAGAASASTAAAASATTTARPHTATQRPVSAHRFPISPIAQFRAIHRKFRCCCF